MDVEKENSFCCIAAAMFAVHASKVALRDPQTVLHVLSRWEKAQNYLMTAVFLMLAVLSRWVLRAHPRQLPELPGSMGAMCLAGPPLATRSQPLLPAAHAPRCRARPAFYRRHSPALRLALLGLAYCLPVFSALGGMDPYVTEPSQVRALAAWPALPCRQWSREVGSHGSGGGSRCRSRRACASARH